MRTISAGRPSNREKAVAPAALAKLGPPSAPPSRAAPKGDRPPGFLNLSIVKPLSIDANFGAAVLLAIITFFGVLLTLGRQVDNVARQREEAQVSATLKDLIQTIGALGKDNLIWDEAVENLDNHFNDAWATIHIGHYFCADRGFRFVYVLGAKDRPIYGMIDNRPVSPDRFASIRALAMPLVRDVRAQEARRGPASRPFKPYPPMIQSIRIVRHDSRLSLLIASLVQPENGAVLPIGPRSSITVASKDIDSGVLNTIADRLLLKDLHLAPPGARAGAFLDLTDPSGASLGRLVWTPDRPGSYLALIAMGPMLLLVALPLGLLHRGNRLARRAEMLEEERGLAAASAQAKSDFLANMSHEIRTPMNGVLAMLELLEHTKLDSRQTRMVGTISTSARSLLAILNDILDHSKMEAGQMAVERIASDPVEVVENVTRLFLGAASAKGIALRCFIAASVKGQYYLDPVRLQQILGNLVSNAIKFTLTGDVTIVMDTVLSADGGLRLRVVTTDTGIGISEEMQEKLFEPFTQADQTTARRFGGTGLGLAICRRLVELMGGEIYLESLEGRGTRVAFQVPVQPVATQAEPTSPMLRGVRIGLVTSDPDERTMFADYLTDLGATVTPIAADTLGGRPLAPFNVVLAPQALADVVQPALARRRGHAESISRCVFYANDDMAFDSTPTAGVIVTTSLSRSRIAAAVAVAAGRSVAITEPDPVIEPLSPNESPCRDDAIDQGRMILLAEDHPVNRDVILRQLKLLGYAADAVEDGFQVLEALANTDYALLLTDCHLPEMDGFTLTRRIRSQEGEGRRLPIIAVTANAMKGEAERCFAAGMDDYLAKPVQLTTLRARLERWLPAAASAAVVPVAAAPPPDSSGEAPALDLAMLEPYFGGNARALHETLDLFVESLKSDLSGLAAAVPARDAPAVESLAHRINGAAKYVGASRIETLSGGIVAAARIRDWSAIDPDLARLQNAGADVEAQVDRLRQAA